MWSEASKKKGKQKHKLHVVQVANTTAMATSPANHDEPRRVGMPSGILSDVNPLMLSLRFNVGQASQDVADDPILVDLIVSLHIIRIATTPPLVVASPGHVDDASSEDEAP